MLYYPLNPDKSFVKRVIAEEGDTVRIVDGRVYVNDVPLHDDYVPTEYRSHDDWGPQVIPEGYYFVMGDHRNNSSDSRHWGMVPKKYIIGKVQVRWWPVPNAHGVLSAACRDPLQAPRSLAAVLWSRVLVLNLVVAVAKIALRLRQRRHQHPLRRLPLPHRRRLERRRPRRGARRQPPARRRSSLRPSQVRDGGRRRHPDLPGAGARRRCCGAAIDRLRSGEAPEIHALAFAVMGVTLLINLGRRAVRAHGRRAA